MFRFGQKRSTGISFVSIMALVLIMTLVSMASAIAADSNLPGGTAISVDVTSPLDGAVIPETDLSIALNGTASIGEGLAITNTLVVYVLDVSGSTTSAGGCGGDLNLDGSPNTILDCEIASALALNQQAIALGTVGEVGVAVFAGQNDPNWTLSGAAGDVNPTAGFQLVTDPASDVDTLGGYDVEQTLKTARSNLPNRLTLFTPRIIPGNLTNYEAGIRAALQVVAASTMPN